MPGDGSMQGAAGVWVGVHDSVRTCVWFGLCGGCHGVRGRWVVRAWSCLPVVEACCQPVVVRVDLVRTVSSQIDW